MYVLLANVQNAIKLLVCREKKTVNWTQSFVVFTSEIGLSTTIYVS